MRMDAGQHMRMSQQMKLAPRMIQSMEILQLASQALEERIEQELVNNPTLELREPGPDREELQAQREQDTRDARDGERELNVGDSPTEKGQSDDFERLGNISDEYGDQWESNNYGSTESYRPARSDGERDAKLDAMANTAARGMSLHDQLLEQWRLSEISEGHLEIGAYLVGYIDNDGYIRTDAQTLLINAPKGVTADQIEQGIKLLQQALEPVGLAARDLRECLLLQIDATLRELHAEHDRLLNGSSNGADLDNADEDRLDMARQIVADHLKDVELNRLPRIARALDVEIDDVKQALLSLRQFHPHPGRMLVEDSPQTIRPDAIIDYDETRDCYVARLASDRTPILHVNNHYAKMGKDRSIDRETREFVNNNIRSARWLIDAIQQRSSTLLRVINVVIAAQREFLDGGPQHLRPLPMTTVADQLGIHVATVSRAVSDKYVQTPRGIFPLRMFFSGGTNTDEGEAMSWSAVQAKLKEIVDEEDKAKPLNDDELVESLKARGIEIARRTVAKYRKQMNIPTARQRREF